MKLAFIASLRHFLLLAAALAVLGLNNGWAALSGDDLLEPEKAFRISTRALDRQTVEVRFEIADGYYMYRDRFKFETAGFGIAGVCGKSPGGGPERRRRDAGLRASHFYRIGPAALDACNPNREHRVSEARHIIPSSPSQSLLPLPDLMPAPIGA